VTKRIAAQMMGGDITFVYAGAADLPSDLHHLTEVRWAAGS
jgi:hypothetical protein